MRSNLVKSVMEVRHDKEINAKDVVDIKANLDMSKISFNGENFIGLDEQINILKETKGYLFNNKVEIIICNAKFNP